METVLNIGLNDDSVLGLAGMAGERFAWDSYRRLLQMYGKTVLDLGVYVLSFAQYFLGTPDVVHAHDWLVAHPSIALAEFYDVPLVATIHATEAGRHSGWVAAKTNRQVHSVEWWLAREADAFGEVGEDGAAVTDDVDATSPARQMCSPRSATPLVATAGCTALQVNWDIRAVRSVGSTIPTTQGRPSAWAPEVRTSPPALRHQAVAPCRRNASPASRIAWALMTPARSIDPSGR